MRIKFTSCSEVKVHDLNSKWWTIAIRDHCLRIATNVGVHIMSELVYRNGEVVVMSGGVVNAVNRAAWGAIWIGVFTFVAIWSVFGMLGEAVFASSANPNAPAPIAGMSIGMGIWAIVLTIIAMYVAGRVTAHFADLADRTGRIMHGMAMFGLSVFTVALMVILGGSAMSGGAGVAGNTHSPHMLTMFSDVGWIGFLSLFFGWLAAMTGVAHGPIGRVGKTEKSVNEKPAEAYHPNT